MLISPLNSITNAAGLKSTISGYVFYSSFLSFVGPFAALFLLEYIFFIFHPHLVYWLSAVLHAGFTGCSGEPHFDLEATTAYPEILSEQ